jgi:exoribonuclease R
MDKLEAYKVHINDRGYNSWSFYTSHNFKLVELPIIPADCKLLSDDLFTIDENNNVNIIHSTIRTYKEIAGVLIVNNNKTYGRKNGKLLYKCVPDDIRLPAFLIPYEMKNVGFSKVFNNLYITFKFKEWNDKHPHATINQTIGPVDVLDNFYEYQLYCKTLNTSIQKFTKDTNQILKDNDHNKFIELIMKKHPSIIDRTNQSEWSIFSIDPEKSVDFDDAFSIKQLPNFIHNNKTYDNVFQLSIYISNVPIVLDYLNLWDSLSERISTIYMPDKRIPMLPSYLSEDICSLKKNTKQTSES